MAKDRVREEANKSSTNRITSLAKAALTVGVGAAVFYRGGGRKLLSEGTDISTRFLSGAADSIKRGDLKSKGIASFISNQRTSWSEIATEVRSRTYEKAMPKMSDKNIAGFVQNIYNLMHKGGTEHLEEMFDAKNVTPQIRSTINKMVSASGVGKIENLSPKLKRGIEELTADLPKTLKNHEQMQELLNKSGLDKYIGMQDLEDAGSEIKKILDNSYEAKRDFIEKNKYRSGGIIDQIIDKLLDPESIRKKYGSTDKDTFFDKILGDKGLSIGRYMENRSGLEETSIHYLSEDGSFLEKNLAEALEGIAETIAKKGEEARRIFESIEVDKFNLRVKGDEIYSFQKSMEIFDKVKIEFGETVPGKILKTRSLRERTFAPIYQVMPTGHHDIMISAMMSKTKDRSFKLEEDMIRVFDKIYKVSDGNLQHIKELDNMSVVPSRYSSQSKMMNKIMGNANYKKSGNILGRYLDIGQTPGYTVFNWLGDTLGLTARSTDHRIRRNLLKDLKGAGAGLSAMDSVGHNRNLDRANEINMFFRKYTPELREDVIEALSGVDGLNVKTKNLFDIIKIQDNKKFMDRLNQELMNNELAPEGMANLDASSILKKYMRDPIGAQRIAPLRGDPSDFFGGKRSSDLAETIRVELGKEAFIQEALSSSKSQDRILEVIEQSGISGRDKTATKMMAEWGAFQSMTGMFNAGGKGKSEKEIAQMSGRIQDIFDSTKETDFLRTFKKDLFRSMKEKPGFRRGEVRSGIFREGLETADDLFMQEQSPEWVHMNKGIGIISAINDSTKRKGFFKQFIAGRNDPENMTWATFPPYFYVHRIPEAMSRLGLNFSSESTGNILDYSKNLATKRILPLVIGYTYLDYLSDTVGRVTGTTLKGYAASGLANVDLGTRRILDTVGVGGFLRTERELNPASHYYFGDYMDSDERREWYQSGYSPMRKSRWWNFGSLNEWRGSEIAYFQPNYLRRAHSSWSDASLYDSLGEKWSRSWLPTPTSPLSPIRYLMNPYWLEEKHAEERPYMMSGKMFAEETPWGAVLNPTLGQVVKPQKRMHADRLDKNYVDVKWLIEQRNMDQMYKAQNKNEQHMVRIRDGIIENVLYTPLDSPTPSQRIMSMSSDEYGNIRIDAPTGYQQFSGVGPARQTIDGREGLGDSAIGSGLPSIGLLGGLTYERPATGLSFADRVNIGAQSGNLRDEIFASVFSPTYDIGVINRSIYEKAAARNNRPVEKGIVTPESINISQARFGAHILKNKEALADLRGLSSGDDLIGELAYTARYMTGLHGYVAYRAFPGQPRTKVEDASGMTSTVRRFWDTNIGGLGGSDLEVARRFIPFQNRRAQRFNPLMNTQEDWLPERFRFGDPFTKLPKGEMRLPGRGYESLNQLNPDEYGEYGAFDRMKILADISPFSHEYKVWRDIAQRTVQDPELKEEMQDIRRRVTEQSKKYDFYGYRFLGRGLERQSAVIEEVMNNNYFTVVGNNNVYRMAGITVKSGDDPDEGVLEQFIKPGMNVTVAIDENEYKRRNIDQYNSINAAVLIDGQNLNKQLVDQKMAEMRENDLSAAAHMAKFGDFQIAYGKAMEALSHAPIPYFQQKFFKIRDPLESYKHEQVYGTSYSSWSSPIKSFLYPSIERSLMSGKEIGIGMAAYGLYSHIDKLEVGSKTKTASKLAMLLTNRGAGIGALTGKIAKFDYGSTAKSMAKFGAMAQVAGYAYTRQDNLIEAPIGFGAVGAYLGTHLIEESGGKKGALIGAAVGLAVAASKGSLLDDDGLFPKWIPKRTKEKWEMQEYFDRLNYIKYSGLYEKAATKAMRKEGTNIRGFVNQFEKDKEEKNRMRAELEDYKEITKRFYAEGDSRAEAIIGSIDDKLSSIQDSEMIMTVGKYGRAALAYKQAMDSTMYGLKEGASWAQLLRAVPRNERDHFMAFAQEQDPKERENILNYVSPYMRRAYQIAWGEKPDRQESMGNFFGGHYLPAPTWSGWRPETDLQNVQIKTIQNEGQLLSDYGFYESQLRDPDVIDAPNLRPDRGQSTAMMHTSLLSNLHGLGLTGVDVSIDKTNVSGFQVISNIKRITEYNVQQGFKKMLSII